MNEESGQLREGQVVNDRWEVQFLLGVGELAEVYEVTDRKTAGSAVLKLFARQFLEVPTAWRNYQEHAERVRALGMPALVNPYAFGIHDETASPFSVSERVAVPALDQLVATVGTLLPAQFARILREFAPLLDSAHRAGVVHRNLKPSNIYCGIQSPKGVRIGDFAVSALRRELSPYPGWGGTPGWVAPEALDPHATDQVSMDIYAVGLLAFFTLTDRSPFLGLANFEPQAFQSELLTPLPSMSERARAIGAKLDPILDEWFRRALAVHPVERFTSVGQMATELLELTGQPPGSVRGTSEPPHRAAPVAQTTSIRAPALSGDPGVASASVQPLVFNAALPRPAARPVADATAPAAPPVAMSRATGNSAQAKAQAAYNSKAVLLAATGTLVIAILAVLIVGGVLLSERAAEQNQHERLAIASASAAATSPATEAVPSIPSGPPPPASAQPPSSPAPVAKVKFDCSPTACSAIHCDGQEYTQLDSFVELPAGEHRCIGSADGYLPLITSFEVEAGEQLTHAMELKEKVAPSEPPANQARKKPAATRATKPKSGKPKGQEATPCGTFINPCK